MAVPPSERIVRRADDGRSFVTRRIAGETLLLPVTGHVANLESIYVMNEVGSRIWDLLQAPVRVDGIAAALAGEFDVSAEQVGDDVAEFLGALGDRGLIEYVGERG
jgi:hypothetical protein